MISKDEFEKKLKEFKHIADMQEHLNYITPVVEYYVNMKGIPCILDIPKAEDVHKFRLMSTAFNYIRLTNNL